MLMLPHYPGPVKPPLGVFEGPPPSPVPTFSGGDRLRELYEAWLAGRKPTTVRAYRGDVEQFAKWAAQPDAPSAVRWLFAMDAGQANHCALTYRNAMSEASLSAATIARRLSALKSLGQLARVLGLCNWAIEIDGPTPSRYRDVEGPGKIGWASLLAVAKADKSDQGVRDYALVMLAHNQALRRAELATLDLADLEIEATVEHGQHVRRISGIWIHGKGREAKERLTIPLPVSGAVLAWIDRRGNTAGALFHRLDRGSTGKPSRMSGENIRLICLRLSKAAGLTKVCRPHGIRHRSGTDALDAFNGDVRKVAKFMRHKNIQTTLIYDDRRRDDAGQVAAMLAEDY